jgi:hypothetical protein
MKTNVPFYLLTHEEFSKLPTQEKFAYLARATVSTAAESQPSKARRKPARAQAAPKAKRMELLAQRGAATSGSE